MHNEVVDRAKRGDEEAFDALARQVGDRCMAIASRILRDVDLAEDAVQAALIAGLAGAANASRLRPLRALAPSDPAGSQPGRARPERRRGGAIVGRGAAERHVRRSVHQPHARQAHPRPGHRCARRRARPPARNHGRPAHRGDGWRLQRQGRRTDRDSRHHQVRQIHDLGLARWQQSIRPGNERDEPGIHPRRRRPPIHVQREDPGSNDGRGSHRIAGRHRLDRDRAMN